MVKFTCVLCGKKFDKFTDIWEHMLNTHKAHSNTCTFCTIDTESLDLSKISSELGIYIDIDTVYNYHNDRLKDYLVIGIPFNTSLTYEKFLKNVSTIKQLLSEINIDPRTLTLDSISNVIDGYLDEQIIAFTKELGEYKAYKLLEQLLTLSEDDEKLSMLKNKIASTTPKPEVSTEKSITQYVKKFVYNCPLCGTMFTNKELLAKHLSDYHHTTILNPEDFKHPILTDEAINVEHLLKEAILDKLYNFDPNSSVLFNTVNHNTLVITLKINRGKLTLPMFEEIVETVFQNGYKYFGKIIDRFTLSDIHTECGVTYITFTMTFKE